MPLVGLRILPYNDLGAKQISKGGGGVSEPPTLKFNMQKKKNKEKRNGVQFWLTVSIFCVATLLELVFS